MDTQNNLAIKFFDYDGQWLIPIVLADKLNHPQPYILCQIHTEYSYVTYNNLLDEFIGETPWYENYTKQLELVTSFQYDEITYKLYCITNKQAYHQLCARVSLDSNIVFNIFSGDYNPEDIKEYIQQGHYYNQDKINTKGHWHYWITYGGGADEHYANFFTQDTSLAKQFHTYLMPDKRAELFTTLNSSTFTASSNESGSLPIQFAKLRQEPPAILLCKYYHSLNYGEYSWDLGEYLPSPLWYEPYTRELQFIDQFTQENITYQVFSITNVEAFHILWKAQVTGLSFIHRTAQAIFAADCNIEELKRINITNSILSHTEDLRAIASWAYIYPMGIDNLRFFYAKDETILQQFEQLRYKQSSPLPIYVNCEP